jgi:hypothetical protein
VIFFRSYLTHGVCHDNGSLLFHSEYMSQFNPSHQVTPSVTYTLSVAPQASVTYTLSVAPQASVTYTLSVAPQASQQVTPSVTYTLSVAPQASQQRHTPSVTYTLSVAPQASQQRQILMCLTLGPVSQSVSQCTFGSWLPCSFGWLAR